MRCTKHTQSLQTKSYEAQHVSNYNNIRYTFVNFNMHLLNQQAYFGTVKYKIQQIIVNIATQLKEQKSMSLNKIYIVL